MDQMVVDSIPIFFSFILYPPYSSEVVGSVKIFRSHFRFPFSAEFWTDCVLGGTQCRDLSRYNSEENENI